MDTANQILKLLKSTGFVLMNYTQTPDEWSACEWYGFGESEEECLEFFGDTIVGDCSDPWGTEADEFFLCEEDYWTQYYS
jgi:hypothetical protein